MALRSRPAQWRADSGVLHAQCQLPNSGLPLAFDALGEGVDGRGPPLEPQRSEYAASAKAGTTGSSPERGKSPLVAVYGVESCRARTLPPVPSPRPGPRPAELGTP